MGIFIKGAHLSNTCQKQPNYFSQNSCNKWLRYVYKGDTWFLLILWGGKRC